MKAGKTDRMLRNAELTTNKTLQIMNEKTRLIWGELNKVMTYKWIQ